MVKLFFIYELVLMIEKGIIVYFKLVEKKNLDKLFLVD